MRYSWQLLDAGPIALDGGGMFGVVPRVLWSKKFPPDDKNRITLRHNCLLLKSEDAKRTVLIETGSGDKFGEKDRAIFGLSDRSVHTAIAEANVDPGDLTNVIVTHLHFDHAGGLTRLDGDRPVLSFPNAAVHVQSREYRDAVENHSVMTKTYLPENLQPLEPNLKLANGDGEVLPGLYAFAVPGHTWGQQAISFTDTMNRSIVFTPDVLPTASHVGRRLLYGLRRRAVHHPQNQNRPAPRRRQARPDARARPRTANTRRDSSRGRRRLVYIGADATVKDLRSIAVEVIADERVLREGGGARGIERQKKLGRMTARERIAALRDDGAPLLELGLWAGWEMYPDAGGTIPAAGVVVAITRVSGRDAMIVANDATVKAGAFFPATAKKVLRAQNIAFACGLPLVYLVDSAGVYLPMQDEVFPDEDDFGRIFRNNAVLSAAGVPQLAAVMGNCVAGGAYLPVLSDKMLMTKGSELYLAGPALVKAAIGQTADADELGGAEMHAAVSGTVDFLEDDDNACIKRLKSLISHFPGFPDAEADASGPSRDPQSLYDLPLTGEYDARDLLAGIIDAGTFDEYKQEYGQSLVCGYARLGGRSVGIVANQRQRVKTAKREVQVGGVIYHDAADKAARFVMDCDQTGLPILFFQDVAGFMVGTRSEQAGVIRSGAKLVNAVSNCRVPKITTVVGGSYGAGNYALCGKAFDPTFIFAWPHAKYAVMGAGQAAKTLVQLAKRQAERAGEEFDDAELTKAVTGEYEHKADIRYGAARGWVDAIIAPHDTRNVLAHALSLATRPTPRSGFRGGVLQV